MRSQGKSGTKVGERTRLKRILRGLERRYGKIEPPPKRKGLPLIVATILSQNTTDLTAIRAYEALLERFPPARRSRPRRNLPRDSDGRIDKIKIRMVHVADARGEPNWRAIEKAPLSVVRNCLRVCGLAETKTRALRSLLKALRKETGGYSLERFLAGCDTDQALDKLSALPGIGVKTAAVTLAEGFGADLCPVDTHVHRVSGRLGVVSPSGGRNGTFRELRKILPPGTAHAFHHLFLSHGRAVCTARRPKCDSCPIRPDCERRGLEEV
ncbi:MAG: hypothetical protein D6679_12215 [Candidatus Hydrogenedentota bacterium]|nr:MAG: hypothetical protein D6679_12215 [Candidatus Hydrogenedentota bacterium]